MNKRQRAILIDEWKRPWSNLEEIESDRPYVYVNLKALQRLLQSAHGYRTVKNCARIMMTYVELRNKAHEKNLQFNQTFARLETKVLKYFQRYLSVMNNNTMLLEDPKISNSFFLLIRYVQRREIPFVMPDQLSRAYMIAKLSR